MSLAIYHTSDLHDRRGIVEPLRRLRAAEPGLLFDCGDSLRGSQTIYHAREPISAEIAAAGYDAQAMGNREFHYLFAAVRARLARMSHPVVCSNLIDTRERALPFRSELDFEVADGAARRRIRIIALLVPQYPEGSPWERVFGWRFLSPYAVAAKYAAAKVPGSTLIVLSHIGLRADHELARCAPQIDLILGGHSHDTLHEPQLEGGVPIVHAGPYGKYVSRTRLRFDADRARIESFALLPLREAA